MFVDESTSESEDLRLKFTMLRGKVVTAFAHVEFLMKHYLVRLAELKLIPKEKSYSQNIETTLKNFVAAVRSVDIPKIMQTDIIDATQAFSNVIEDRNDLVHGLASLNTKEKSVIVKRYRGHGKDKNPQMFKATFHLHDMEEKFHLLDQICLHLVKFILNMSNYLNLGFRSEKFTPFSSN